MDAATGRRFSTPCGWVIVAQHARVLQLRALKHSTLQLSGAHALLEALAAPSNRVCAALLLHQVCLTGRIDKQH